MKLRQIGERRLIKSIRRQSGRRRAGIPLGIGDDAAVVRGPKDLLLTKDLLVEGVDFRKTLHPPFLLGRKSLNVSLSDIAAMGGSRFTPCWDWPCPGIRKSGGSRTFCLDSGVRPVSTAWRSSAEISRGARRS